jgi:hypothetical protein
MAIASLLGGDQVGCSVMGGMDGWARRGLWEERRVLYTHAKERMIHQFLLQISSGEDEEERSRIRPTQRELVDARVNKKTKSRIAASETNDRY